MEERELEVRNSVRNSPCHVSNCLLGLCKFRGKDDVASRDNFLMQFLSLIPWPLQRILFAGSASKLPREKRDFLEFKGGHTVFLSVSLSDRQNLGQEVIIAGIGTNTQGENKDQNPDIATSWNKL